jgi:glutamate 5-kinase
VSGHFSRGEVVRLSSFQGDDLARGASRYSSDALRCIQSHHLDQIQRLLGYTYGPVAIHRDDMIFCDPRISC